jgi:predicted amidohydrolase YtcJ
MLGSRLPPPLPGDDDILFLGGTVITMDEQRTRAEALWVRGNRVVATGTAAELGRLTSRDARRVDLAGATMVPGFIDAHCHVGVIGYLLDAADCTPSAAPTIPDILDRLRRAAATTPIGGWVTGQGYLEYGLVEGRHPTREEIDRVVPDRPSILYHRSLHGCVLNSAALDAAGFRDGAPDPPNGLLGRDAAGRLTGTVFEAPMFALLEQNAARTLARLTPDRRAELMAAAAQTFAAEGVTWAVDADLPGLACLAALRDAERANRLPIRVSAMINRRDAGWALQTRLAGGFGSDMLRLGGVKVFADGGMSSRTAAMDEPYKVASHGRGILFEDHDGLVEIIARCEEAGSQVGIHAQGDRAIRTVLGAFEQVIGRGSGNPLRHRIEHGGTFLPPLIEQAAAIGIHVVSQPGFLPLLGDGWIGAFGEPWAQRLYPFRSLREAGLVVGGSSDAPVIPNSVRAGLAGAILRRTDSGIVLGPGERLSADEALELYTRSAAFLAGVDGEAGSLERGKFADFVIFGDDPTRVDPETLPDLPILQTVVGGRHVHGDRLI